MIKLIPSSTFGLNLSSFIQAKTDSAVVSMIKLSPLEFVIDVSAPLT